MSDTILAVIELDRFPEAVASRAAWIARRLGCDLEREGLKITTSVLDDSPASDAIVARALDIEPKFVIKGTEHHSPAERARFTYTDWRLIRKLDYPLWLVKPKEWKDRPVIIAAVDPTHKGDRQGVLDQKIVGAGRELAAKCNGTLQLLHTYVRLVEIGRHAMFAFKPVKLPIDELEDNIRELHREKLDALAAANDIPIDAVHQLPGRAHEILPMFARAQGADLVIMGAIARSGLKSRVLGSTAAKVLDHLPCDILIEQRTR
jgi:universal stress protein E